MKATLLLTTMAAALSLPVSAQDVTTKPDREAYFGNFHVHTCYSFDG